MSFTLRFYTVEKRAAHGLSLQQALEHVNNETDFSQRERQLKAGYIVRLERYAVDAGDLTGEFTRVRTTDFPFEVRPDGVEPLNTVAP